MAQVWPVDGGEVSDGGESDRSVFIPGVRDHFLRFYHEQETPLPADHCGHPGPHHSALLRPP